jgi:adenylate cyclase
MFFKCRNKKFRRIVLLLNLALCVSAMLFWFLRGSVWTGLDAQLTDIIYARVVQDGHGPHRAPQIVYVTITDDSYKQFGTRSLDRVEMARVNEALAQLGVAAVAYDVIFSLPSTPEADARFTASLQQLGRVYLPSAVDQSPAAQPFRWGSGTAYERLRSQLRQPQEQGTAQPLYATRALVQFDAFAEAAFKTAHISATNDADGVYRWLPLVLKVETGYLPAMTLAMFLDAVQVPLEALAVHWGQTLTIPALPTSRLRQDVVIPIDAYGRTRVPYPQVWGRDFPSMPMHRLLALMDDPDVRGNLQEFFEDKFVIIGDVSTGIADAGQTPLERYVPLVAMHAAFMNALLTHTFLHTWSFWQVMALLGGLGLLIAVAALPESLLPLYSMGVLLVLGLWGLTWWQCLHLTLLPLATLLLSLLWMFGGTVVGLQVAIAHDQAFIRNAFAKYVSPQVVDELLQHRELLHLGGEERVISVLFSDIANFTSLAEQLPPQALVKLLNAYLTAMTTIVMEQGGIIDKYIGDAIMAEFGAPLPIPKHADLAVRTALRMQRRLDVLRPQWLQEGFPELYCRVGINTGPMVVGNIGSEQVFNYTVIGDAVNLASRLEGANKHYETMVMISEFTYQALTPHLFHTRLLDTIRVKGKSQAVKVYEVYGEQGDDIAAADLKYYQAYNAAFVAYLERRFDVARTQFAAALEIRPQDISTLEMLARLTDLDQTTLADDWDGATTFETK